MSTYNYSYTSAKTIARKKKYMVGFTKKQKSFLLTSIFCLVPIVVGILYNQIAPNQLFLQEKLGTIDQRNMVFFVYPLLFFICDYLLKLLIITEIHNGRGSKEIPANLTFLIPLLSLGLVLLEISADYANSENFTIEKFLLFTVITAIYICKKSKYNNLCAKKKLKKL